jgi:hypothetical protein
MDWTVPDPVANSTILDAQEQGRVIYVGGYGVTATLTGLTIQNGDATGLGGYLPFVDAAGGVYFTGGGRLEVSQCTIVSNTTGDGSDGDGGGLFVEWSDNSLISSNLIADNESINYGGGG